MHKISKIILLMCITVPQFALALGLGQIRVHSALYQPFNATVKLVGVNKISTKDIRVRLAKPEQYKLMHIKFDYRLSNLKFDVVRKRGRSMIKITSEEAMEVPYLKVLLDVDWPEGQIFRAYTFLLDPPVYGKQTRSKRNKHAKVQSNQTASAYAEKESSEISKTQPVSKAAKNKTVDKPVAEKKLAVEKKSQSAENKPQSAEADKIWTVSRNQTLYQIAKKIRPNNAISMNQLMLALLAKNSQAFANDDMNALHVGARLRIPTLKEVNTISKVQATKELAAQYQAARYGDEVMHEVSIEKIKSQMAKVSQEGHSSDIAQSEAQYFEPQGDFDEAQLEQQHKTQTKNAKSRPVIVSQSKTPEKQSSLNEENQVKESDENSPEAQAEMIDDTDSVEESALIETSQSQQAAEKRLQAELAVSVTAVNAVRKANDHMAQQLSVFEEQNHYLRLEVQNRDAEIDQLKAEVRQLMSSARRVMKEGSNAKIDSSMQVAMNGFPGVGGQVNLLNKTSSTAGWKFLFATVILFAFILVYFLYFRFAMVWGMLPSWVQTRLETKALNEPSKPQRVTTEAVNESSENYFELILENAKQCIAEGDTETAKHILGIVIAGGDDILKMEAEELLGSL